MKLFTAISSLLALLVTSKADGLGGLVYAPGHASLNYYTYPSYAFEYAVRDPHTGDNKAQWEKRDGDAVIGAYSLVEPDGTIRVVEYRADDKSGFNAVVKRIGPNLHPVSAPIYKAPIPVLGQKLITPLSIGPVAGLKGLADAPLLSGNYLGGLGGAVSSANLYKDRVPVIKDIGPIAEVGPILPAPILKEPLLGLSRGPILKESLLPLSHGPVLKEPIGSLHSAPIYKGPLSYGPAWKEPLLGSLPYGPILPAPIKEPLLGPLIKEPLLGPLNYGPIIKEPIGLDLGYGGNLDYGLLGKELLNKGGYGLGH